MKGRVIANIPGDYRTLQVGDGIFEIYKEVDVLCMTPETKEKKKDHDRLITSSVVAAGVLSGAGLCGMFVMPVMGVLFIIGLAWIGVVAYANRG